MKKFDTFEMLLKTTIYLLIICVITYASAVYYDYYIEKQKEKKISLSIQKKQPSKNDIIRHDGKQDKNFVYSVEPPIKTDKININKDSELNKNVVSA